MFDPDFHSLHRLMLIDDAEFFAVNFEYRNDFYNNRHYDRHHHDEHYYSLRQMKHPIERQAIHRPILTNIKEIQLILDSPKVPVK